MHLQEFIFVLLFLFNLFSIQAEEVEREKYGIMKLDGTILTPAIYDEIFDFVSLEPERQHIELRKDNQEWLIGSEGTVVNKSGYDYIGYINGSLYDVGKDGKAGLINSIGEEIIPLAYKSFVNFDKLRQLVYNAGNRQML